MYSGYSIWPECSFPLAVNKGWIPHLDAECSVPSVEHNAAFTKEQNFFFFFPFSLHVLQTWSNHPGLFEVKGISEPRETLMPGVESLKINETNRKECWEKKRGWIFWVFLNHVNAPVVQRIMYTNQQVMTGKKCSKYTVRRGSCNGTL